MDNQIDPYSSELIEDYAKVMRTFGIEPYVPGMFPDENRLMRRGIVFGGRDLKVIADCMRNKKPFYVLSGIMPSAERVHFGNKMVVDQIKYFQEHGAETYILVADMEAAAARGVDLETARKNALKFQIPAYLALGLDPKKTKFYFQSDNRAVLMLAYEFAKRITLAEFQAIYGNADPGRIMSAVTQVGDILYPQLEKRMPGIIPVGIDQDPHIRLTRDIVARTQSKYKFVAPASIYHKYMPSLDGSMKMSKSRPESFIELPEPEESYTKKLRRTLTGGRETVEIQRKLGGIPEKCMIYELYRQHLIEDDSELEQVYKDCKAGTLLCGENKQNAVKRMKAFMDDLEKGIERCRKTKPRLLEF